MYCITNNIGFFFLQKINKYIMKIKNIYIWLSILFDETVDSSIRFITISNKITKYEVL